MSQTGFFITLEGPEGAGKSTQLKLLADRLAAAGRSVVTTREPGGTPLAEELRNVVKHYHGPDPLLPETELLLFAAARAQHVRQVILPALASGKVVLCDRFLDSTEAYQGAGRALDQDFLRRLNVFATARRMPDLTILIDLAPETGMARAKARAARFHAAPDDDRMEAEKMDFHRKVREGVLAIARREPERVKVFDGTLPPEALHDAIMEEVRRVLG